MVLVAAPTENHKTEAVSSKNKKQKHIKLCKNLETLLHAGVSFFLSERQHMHMIAENGLYKRQISASVTREMKSVNRSCLGTGTLTTLMVFLFLELSLGRESSLALLLLLKSALPLMFRIPLYVPRGQ